MWFLGKADGHEVVKHLRMIHNLPGAQSASATIVQAVMQGG
jgi:hypothetical protein